MWNVNRKGGVMKIHEYQAKEILRNYGVPIPKGGVAETPEEALRLPRGSERRQSS